MLTELTRLGSFAFRQAWALRRKMFGVDFTRGALPNMTNLLKPSVHTELEMYDQGASEPTPTSTVSTKQEDDFSVDTIHPFLKRMDDGMSAMSFLTYKNGRWRVFSNRRFNACFVNESTMGLDSMINDAQVLPCYMWCR